MNQGIHLVRRAPSRFDKRSLHANAATLLSKYYKYVRWWLCKKSYACKTTYPVRRVDISALNSFFGYYDKSPLNSTENFIVYHTVDFETSKKPNPSVPVHIIVNNRLTGEIIDQLDSFAYNWQQGTRLQWLSDDQFVFNCYDSSRDEYISRIYSVGERAIVAMLQVPVYDCYLDKFALTLNFRRLASVSPDYGYFCHRRNVNLDDIGNDGVWRINLCTGENELILSLSQLVGLAPSAEMSGAQHSVNHIMISPDGSRFVVIHRWYKNGKRYDRLLVAAVDGSEVKILADEGMVSHCFWQDDSHLLSYLRYKGSDSYYVINVITQDFAPLGPGLIDGFGDGHPHILGGGIIFDTYPARSRMQKLFLFDSRNLRLQFLGEFYESLKFRGVTRCDLHPRFDRKGASIFFDSVHDGTRQLYEMRLDES